MANRPKPIRAASQGLGRRVNSAMTSWLAGSRNAVNALIASGDRRHPRDGDFVIAFGGGSALDAGKALAALLTNPGDPLDYLEVIGLGRTLATPAAPCIAIPTTAGTGSEVTRNAVLASPGHRVKARSEESRV